MSPLTDPNRGELLSPVDPEPPTYDEFWKDVIATAVHKSTDGTCPTCGDSEAVVILVWRGEPEGVACDKCGFAFDIQLTAPNPFLQPKVTA